MYSVALQKTTGMLIVLVRAVIVADLQADFSAMMVVVVQTSVLVIAVVHLVVNYLVHCVVPFVVVADFESLSIMEPGGHFRGARNCTGRHYQAVEIC
jgi:hypothetical protein